MRRAGRWSRARWSRAGQAAWRRALVRTACSTAACNATVGGRSLGACGSSEPLPIGTCDLGCAASASESESESESQSESESESESEGGRGCGRFGVADWTAFCARLGSGPPVTVVAAVAQAVMRVAEDRFTGFFALSAWRSTESDDDESDESDADTSGRRAADVREDATSTCTSQSKHRRCRLKPRGSKSSKLGAPFVACVREYILRRQCCPIPRPYFLWHSRGAPDTPFALDIRDTQPPCLRSSARPLRIVSRPTPPPTLTEQCVPARRCTCNH